MMINYKIIVKKNNLHICRSYTIYSHMNCMIYFWDIINCVYNNMVYDILMIII